MDFDRYQELAARTINKELTHKEQIMHALHGMVGEVGEIHSIFQKEYQGHEIDEVHLAKEVGDLLWFIAELCTGYYWEMTMVAEKNIDKLLARYPEGFEAEKSLNRKEGDI